ncbi:hypothetical protein [Paenibacillus dendritiformis]|uniref:hypothetical protein n=1 Tax=Paenibacillus dendritiformis TaxID=130049 RepID=UPI000DAA521F|nr:hypothetical protein [Paenibacillus dendritiformis]PZM65156.1 hypothetical protein DOE73_13145 [Paenibacillus dendritiformis]
MTKPIVSWFNDTHTAQIEAPFDFGVIDAGDLGPLRTFNIWNNRNGETDVSKMEDCTFTTRDMGGGTGDTPENDVEAVRNNWFHVQVDTLGETDIEEETSAVGKIRMKPIGTTGKTTKDHEGNPLSIPLTPASQEILGVNNNGNPMDAAGNFVTVTVQPKIPLDASSGRQEFKLRVSYRYV